MWIFLRPTNRDTTEPPKSFEGLPITLVSASIVSLSFFGFSGVLDRLFGG